MVLFLQGVFIGGWYPIVPLYCDPVRHYRQDELRRERTTPDNWNIVVGFLAILFPLLFSALLSSRFLDERLSLRKSMMESYGRDIVLKEISLRPPLTLGFRNFFADVVWLEAVQISGNREMDRREYDRLTELLNIVANFDPRFEVPYLLGGLVLGESPFHAQDAIRLLERGQHQFPSDWRFPFYIGFTRYFSLGDPQSGGRAMVEAARISGSPAYLPGLASRMLSEAREPETALRLLETILRQESDPARRAVLQRRVRDVTVERDLQILGRAVETYREKTGNVPRNLSDLVREGILKAIPEEPNGGNYLLMQGGTVRSDRDSLRLRVFQKR